MNVFLKIEIPLPECKITIRFDPSNHAIDPANPAAGFVAVSDPTGCVNSRVHFDVREIEPGESESIVIGEWVNY